MRFFTLFAALSLFAFSGCYTQFASREAILPSEEVKTVVDSTGDTIKVIERTDTIISQEKETCVWERDLFGRPFLRCYDSNYPRDWYIYNNSPWWYRNDPFWFDYEHCPRYYRYDPFRDRCVFYKHYHDMHGGNPSGGGTSSPPNQGNYVSPRSRSEGIPHQSSVPTQKTSGSSSTSGSTVQTPTPQQNDIQSHERKRSSGIPDQSNIVPPSGKNETASKEPQSQSTGKQESEQKVQQQHQSDSSTTQQPRRRNSRSW